MKMTVEEKENFKKLCDYVHDKVLKYDEDTKLTKKMILRLKGFSQGKYIANNNVPAQAKYSYKMMLLTFKLCKGSINGYLFGKRNDFADENHKFNGIMVILDGEINNTVARLRKAKEAKIKTEEADMSHQQQEQAKYKTKGKKKTNKTTESLW